MQDILITLGANYIYMARETTSNDLISARLTGRDWLSARDQSSYHFTPPTPGKPGNLTITLHNQIRIPVEYMIIPEENRFKLQIADKTFLVKHLEPGEKDGILVLEDDLGRERSFSLTKS